jgi:hypothetical protein
MTFRDKVAEKYVLASGRTMVLWHGGNLDKEPKYSASGRWEFGPGLYLTTHYNVVAKYAKGSRKLYRITVAEGTDIRSVNIPVQDVWSFISKNVIIKKRKEVIDRLSKYVKDDKIPASIVVNSMINHDALKGAATRSLREFLVSQGVDYELVDNAFGWHDKMIVLYNMNKIVKTERVSSKDIEVWDLPTEFK